MGIIATGSRTTEYVPLSYIMSTNYLISKTTRILYVSLLLSVTTVTRARAVRQALGSSRSSKCFLFFVREITARHSPWVLYLVASSPWRRSLVVHLAYLIEKQYRGSSVSAVCARWRCFRHKVHDSSKKKQEPCAS